MKENTRVPDLWKLQSRLAADGAVHSISGAKGSLINEEAKYGGLGESCFGRLHPPVSAHTARFWTISPPASLV